jgi:MarR family transcriptional repressor of emrRAB
MVAEGGGPRQNLDSLRTAMALTRTEAVLARALGRALAPHGVSWPQVLSLLVLDDEPAPLSATRLVERLGLGRTAMTSVVDRLERHGWVERRPSARDRRVTDLYLTDAGHKLAEEIRPLMRAALDRLLAGLPARELAAWQGAVERLGGLFRGRG